MLQATASHKEALDLFRSGDYAGAEQPARHVHDLGFQCGTFLLAKVLLALDRPTESTRLFEACAVYIPTAYLHLGDITGNAEFYLKGHKRLVCECSYKYGLHVLYAKRSPEKALTYFKHAISRPNPVRGDSFFAIAAVCLKLPPRRGKTMDYLVSAASEGSEHAQGLIDQMNNVLGREEFLFDGFSTALALFKEDNHSKAVSALKPFLKNDSPHHTNALYATAFVQLNMSHKIKIGMKTMAEAAALSHPKALSFFKAVEEFV